MNDLLKKPMTARQKTYRLKMASEWFLCFCFAFFIYGNGDDMFPGSWLTYNIFFDGHDKYPYKIKK